jgi:hypothetical protein
LLLFFVLCLSGCGERPRDGEPCDEPERLCGADDFGMSCLDGAWKVICFDCRDHASEIECSVNVCIADDPSHCGQPSNTTKQMFRFQKDGS